MKQKLIIIIIVSVFMLYNKASNAQSFLAQDKVWSDYYHSNYYNIYDENGKFLGFTTAKVTTWHKVGTDSLICKIGVTSGQNSIIIQGSKLVKGMYLYSLIVDEQEVDTKRMIYH